MERLGLAKRIVAARHEEELGRPGGLGLLSFARRR
jgi:hypothetical protein